MGLDAGADGTGRGERVSTLDLKQRFEDLKVSLPLRDVYEYQVLEHVLTIPGDGPEQDALRQRTYDRAMQSAPTA